ncbi:membrane protein [Chlamydia abortus]|nr:membrane protein [Chlamydia abortus]SFW03678.1 membrane protein [Chlamydia abortus]
MTSSIPNTSVFSSHPETLGSRLSLFSDLTPLERGEVSSSWKEKCQRASCIGLFCLSLLTICAGVLVLTLLPTTPVFLGIVFIAVGSVLLVTSLLLHASLRPSKKITTQQVNIRDLQTQLQGLLATTNARSLAINGFDPNGNAELIIQEREALLAKFDRDLRRKEVALYRFLSSGTENRYPVLCDLSAFREMQERISDELELLYRSYNHHIRGTVEANPDERLLILHQERNLLIQQLADMGIEKANQTEALVDLQSTLDVLNQNIRLLEDQIAQNSSHGQQHAGLVSGLQPLLQERNTLLIRLSLIYEALISLAKQEEELTSRRIDLDKDIEVVVESRAERITFNNEYRERFLRSSGNINQLTNNLREKEATLLALTQEVEALHEEVERLRNRPFGGEYTQQDIERYRNALTVKEQVVQDLEEQVVKYRRFLEEAVEVNNRITLGIQESERRSLEFAALEQRERVLNHQIQVLTVDLQKHKEEHQRLRGENDDLRELVLTTESNPGSDAQIEALQKEIRRLTVDLETVVNERMNVSEELAIVRAELTNMELRYVAIKEEMLSRDEENATLKMEAEELRGLVVQNEENLENLQHALTNEMNLKHAVDVLRPEIDRLEQEKLSLNARMLEAVEQNRINIGLLQKNEQEKEQLIQELQGLRSLHAQEKESLQEEITKLQKEMHERHLHHLEETSRLRLENNQLESLLKDAQRMGEHSHEGALRTLGSQLIVLSSHIKQRSKSEIQSAGDVMEMLAFTSPRFFGNLGAGISCRSLRPGVYLEAELPVDASDEQKRVVIEQRCLREWFFALLGYFTVEQIESLSQRARDLVQEAGEQASAHELFDQLASEFSEIRDASGALSQWLSTCYSYVTNLQIFNNYFEWSGFLFSLLQKMHKGTGGILHNLSEEEQQFFKIVSNFSGRVPLVLGSIGHSEGTTPGAANPLGDLNFENVGNITWSRFIRIIEGLLEARSSLSGPMILEMSDIRESVVRTISSNVYTDMLTEKYSPTTWTPPADL